MNLKSFMQSSSNKQAENRLLRFAIVVFAIATVVSSFVSYAALKYSKTIMIFPGAPIEEQMVVSGNKVNEPYVRWFSRYVLNLLLNYTPDTIQNQYRELLFLCSPSFYKSFEPQISNMTNKVKVMSVTSIFTPKGSIKLDTNLQTLSVIGVRQQFAGGAVIESKQLTYEIKYIVQDGRIMLDGISEKQFN